jgi:UDP-N-acetylmuramate dehydrogenase
VRAFDRAVGVFVDLPKAECEFGYRTSIFKREDRFIVTRVRFVFDVGEAAIVRYAEIGRALSVPSGASAPISRIRDAVVALRRTKGMVLDPADSDSVSAGSFFVNPVVDERTAAKVASLAGEPPPSFPLATGERKLAAAWLVERAGFTKGWSKGRVGVSRKHALALVNLGGATARELLAVAHEIRDGVRDLFGVELEPEPRFIGCAWNAVR